MAVETAGPSLEERLKEYEELFKFRYTMHDPEYRATVELAERGGLAPPVMQNWPPVLRGRRGRDRNWRQQPRREHHARYRYHADRDMDYDEALEGYSRSKRQRTQHSYHDNQPAVIEEELSTAVTMTMTDDSGGVVTSPPVESSGREKPHKASQQTLAMSHFVPFSEAELKMGLVENRVAPSDTDVQAILSNASVAVDTRKDVPRSSDKQQTVVGKRKETSDEMDHMISSYKHESSRRPHKKRKTRSREKDDPFNVTNVSSQQLLPLELIEQDDDEGEPPAPVVQVSSTKLIIRPVKGRSPEPHPPADAASATKKSAKKKKKKKEKSQEPLKVKLKIEDNMAHIVSHE